MDAPVWEPIPYQSFHLYFCFHVGIRQRWAFSGSIVVKNPPANAADSSLIIVLGRSPGEGNGYLLQYSCLDNSIDRRVWRATVHGVTKSQTQLSNSQTQTHIYIHTYTHTYEYITYIYIHIYIYTNISIHIPTYINTQRYNFQYNLNYFLSKIFSKMDKGIVLCMSPFCGSIIY